MFNVQSTRPSAPSSDFSDAAIARAKASKAATGLYVSRILVVGGLCGDIRLFVKQAEMANRLGCQAILQVGSFGFQSQRLEGEAYLDQVEKYARRFGVVVVWTPGEDDNVDLLAKIGTEGDGPITLRSHIRCAPDGSSWIWGDARVGTVNDTVLPARPATSDTALSDLDVLVVRGSLLGSDVVVSPKLRVVIYGSAGHRLVSGALPRTGMVAEWAEQTVVDLGSFSFSSAGQTNRGPTPKSSDDFEAGLGQLRQYAVEFEDTFVPRSYVTDDGFRLGRWIANLRTDYETNRLESPKAKALEAIPHWRWDPYEPVVHAEPVEPSPVAKNTRLLVPLSSLPKPARISDDSAPPERVTPPSRLPRPLPFDVWFERLEKFVANHGHARPAKAYIDPEGFKLGRWVSHQRETGRRSRLSPAEAAALEALPGWSWSPKPKVVAPPEPAMAPTLWPNALGGPVGVLSF
jgi:hypothetical protein